MQEKEIRQLTIRALLRLFVLLFVLHMAPEAAGQVRIDQTTTELASRYFSEGDFARAAPLYRDIYAASGNGHYFRLYLQCLIQLGEYSNAENEIRKEIRKSKTPRPEMIIHQGTLLKMQNRPREAEEKFSEAFRMVPANRSAYINTANTLLQWREYELAERLFLEGRKRLPNEKFHSELTQIYLYLRNYSRLIEELLELVRLSETHLPMAQSTLTSALYMDIENDVREEFRAALLKRIQEEPEVTGFNRLLIWFFLQEKQFSAALRQSVALDRRTGSEDLQILSLARMAMNNQNYADAAAAYGYVLGKGKENPAWRQAYSQKLLAGYYQYVGDGNGDREKAREMAREFHEGLDVLGYNTQNINLIKEYAHLLVFYLDSTASGIRVLERGLAMPGLRPLQSGELKSELADIYVFADDPWEATLLYSQVIDANRDNALGDQVKLKKARLGYYLGNFSWARAQLDVLKASTSKLTANDAMELALFLGDHSSSDTSDVAMRHFARADLLFFRHREEEALALLDTIATLFPGHALVDDILLRKARIEERRGDYSAAVAHLEKITTGFSGELLADDALFMMANLLQYKLREPEKAAQAYREILFTHPGSIYVPEARKFYRELTDEEALPGEKETEFFNQPPKL